MPGLKRTPGMPGIDSSFDWSRIPDLPPRTMLEPDSDADVYTESASEDGYSSDALVHEGFENRITPPQSKMDGLNLPQSRTASFEETGLPPTPPTLSNSDVAESKQNAGLSPPALFADGVRNALESKKSGLGATPVNTVSPPTPDPSPPARSEQSPAQVQQKEKLQFLQPTAADTASFHTLRQYASSSRAESFKTAREDQPLSSNETSQVHLPEDDTLPQHWLDSTRELESADEGLGPVIMEPEPEGMRTPKNTRRRSKHESPPQLSPEDTSDLAKHISYVGGPEDLDGIVTSGDAQEDAIAMQQETSREVKGLGVSGAGIPNDMPRSTEDANNMVYKRIQEENLRRHSLKGSPPGAITAGIVVPASESTLKTLKRQTKCLSLREDSLSGSKRDSIGSDPRFLGHKKVRLPERQKKLDDSPEFDSNIRQVSSPARLGPDASNMTALTFASLQDSPSARQAPKFKPFEPEHKLRHFSYNDRLSNNPSIARTSMHGSPATPPNGVVGPNEGLGIPKRGSPALRKVSKNIGVKRDSVEGGKPESKMATPEMGATTSPEEGSPTTTRIRRFSREERLENNDHVRRTSIGHSASPDSRLMQPSPLVSPMSDRTEVELCEASGVRIYPHNNDSLLVVQHGSRPVSHDDTGVPEDVLVTETEVQSLRSPTFTAEVDPPTPKLVVNQPRTNIDSPLTNPREAPEPPVFKFIPPTPNRELEEFITNQTGEPPKTETNPPDRRLSLLQRARRYSDSLFIRTNTHRSNRPRRISERTTHLSPLWRPQGFWDDFDSNDDDDDDHTFESVGALPRGGDTSDVDSPTKRRSLPFPRQMSKRLPGFRGSGGFLLGNSLGLDRHGTNNRRHYVSTSTKVLSPRASAELLRKSPSQELASSPAKKLGARVRALRASREERAREKRRRVLRGNIGMRVFHVT